MQSSGMVNVQLSEPVRSMLRTPTNLLADALALPMSIRSSEDGVGEHGARILKIAAWWARRAGTQPLRRRRVPSRSSRASCRIRKRVVACSVVHGAHAKSSRSQARRSTLSRASFRAVEVEFATQCCAVAIDENRAASRQVLSK